MSIHVKLPEGWCHAKFCELLLAVVGGGTPSRKIPSYFEGTIPWFTVKDMKTLKPDDAEEHISEAAIDNSTTNLVLANTVIVATRIALGRAIRPTVRCAINQDLKALILGTGIDPDFILYWIIANEKVLQDLGSGTTVSGIRLETLNALPLLVPPSAEQTRIVKKLDELFSDLDAGMAELKSAQEKLSQYRRSLLKAAVAGELTAAWRAEHAKRGEPLETGTQLLDRILIRRCRRWEEKELVRFKEQGKTPPKGWKDRYPEGSKPDITNLPELPEGWVWTKVSLVGDVKLGRQRTPKYHTGDNMVPYLRVANVFEDHIDISDVMQMHFTPEEEETFRLLEGDILLNEGQSLELVGRSAIYRNELPRVCFTNTLVRLRMEKGVLPEYAQSVFLHYLHSGRFRKIAKITTNIAHLGVGRFAEIEFPLPGAQEQKAIVDALSIECKRIKEQITAIEHSVKQSTAQRKSILNSAFSGQLVPQDPDDEPASVLLERIRIERTEREKQPKKRQFKDKKEITTMSRKLIDVLTEAGDWLPAQEAFRRCGVADGAETDQIEAVYSELRQLDKANQLVVEAVTDAQGRKQYDRLKLIAKD